MGKKKYTYEVLAKSHGGQRVMLKTSSYKKAERYYIQHPRAFGIQRNVHGVTAGMIQPRVRNKIKFRGKTYTRAYVGPHQKKSAKKMVKGFRKKGMPAQTRKFKRGWFVFVK